jgi:hypothetical protein
VLDFYESFGGRAKICQPAGDRSDKIGLLVCPPQCPPMLPAMFVVSEADAAAIRTAYEQEGELPAAIEVRRLFPGVTDNAKALSCARTIARLETVARRGLSDYPVNAFVGAGLGRRSPDRTRDSDGIAGIAFY